MIAGGGFGGLWAARTLANQPVDVILVDRNNYHTFLPLLYQVAAAELEPEDIAYPIRSILRKFPNVRFVLADIKRIDLGKRVLYSSDYAITYDYLILATGSTTQFFGIPGAAEYSFQLKTLEQGIALRNHILRCFEYASRKIDDAKRQQLLTFTIVGGGPTGVEFAGALAELIHGPLKKDYPSIDFDYVKVVVIEAANSVLITFPKTLRDYALDRLYRMKVNVMLETLVEKVMPQTVHLKDKNILPTETVIWTAGICADPITEGWGFSTARGGLLMVLPTLEIEGHEEIYVVGDLSSIEDTRRQLPMTAPAAVQQGIHAANNILNKLTGRPQSPFIYKDKGAMVTIGRNTAVAQIGKRSFTGFFAWILWLIVQLINLIGFRNRLMVLINWSIDYLLFERAIRLILPLRKQPQPPRNQT
ncbi:pyridine nucleotide-disulfide oxidoreductase [Candidatus Magnetominusculus xianensis]|uniref:NADH:ubiquinone reductase (non-electrogenic) n=1 Tax=Candidatus Magnetominusculus xianensis TaxID=1748249 RepID=A0ABR5SET7_9BACT|nr:pyridine nucleotide-disulfide oxidoreductase [Candidatus Magnetominusculus xianensis]